MDPGFQRIDEALQEVRRISVGLRPKDLDDLGLAAALQSLTQRVSESSQITFETNVITLKDLLTIGQKSALYRVAQEALTNVQRHAQASFVSVNLYVERNSVILEIEDNGRGLGQLSKGKDMVHQGLGLRNMEERVARHGGKLIVVSGRDTNGGARLVAEMPIEQIPQKTQNRQSDTLRQWIRNRQRS